VNTRHLCCPRSYQDTKSVLIKLDSGEEGSGTAYKRPTQSDGKLHHTLLSTFTFTTTCAIMGWFSSDSDQAQAYDEVSHC
jgi:hypothetical protein